MPVGETRRGEMTLTDCARHAISTVEACRRKTLSQEARARASVRLYV
jgi:hypothetical protein